MAREFKETAHLKTNLKKYGDNYDAIFGKKKKKKEDDKKDDKKVDEKEKE